MKKFMAIDVVLLPSKEVSVGSIKLSESITDSQNKILLDPQNCVPHISLVMGCIDVEKLDKIKKIVQEIIKKYEPLKFKIIGVRKRKTFATLEIEKTEEIQALHEEIFNKLKKFMNEKSTKDAFVEPTNINNLTLDLVDNFKKTSSLDKFWPHITLGYGEIKENLNIPKKFVSSTMGIYQLGVFCTCKKNLFFGEIT